MNCPECQFENPHGSNFCLKCGVKLELKCPKCDQTLPAEANFCNACGHNLGQPRVKISKDLSFDEKLDKIQRYLPKGLTEKILSQKDRIEGERKQVTVMFCDMEGFTALSEQIGPEEAYTVMDQVYEILIHKVHDYEGTVNEMTGDGIVALFGAPIALEDAPQRAIRSALAIHRDIAKFSDKIQDKDLSSPIKMRIGIHTGPVVVGTVGNDLRVEFKAVGDTVNLASRIEEITEPGTTYVTEDTYKFVEGLFQFEALGEKEVKGKQKPTGVYRVISPSAVRTSFDVKAKRGLTPYIGRDRELELLLDGLEWAKSGSGQAFSIVGEAGMGKSRLLLELRKSLTNEDVTFLEANCLSYNRNVPYYPIVDALKTMFDIIEEDEESEIRLKVVNCLKKLGADQKLFLPYILDLLSVKESGIDNIPLSPEALKNKIIDTFKNIVLMTSEIQPLIIAIENLHWIDKSSEDTLMNLLETIPGTSVLLLFTYRPEYVHSWGARSYHSQINLNRLSNRESLSMIYHLLGTSNIDRELEEMLLQKAEGIPLFIEEFIKSLKDLRSIEKKNDMYRIVKDIQSVVIPTEIQDIIMARLDSLKEGAKNLIQAGSVIGREFSHNLIEKVTDHSEQELISLLSILKDSELLYERGIYPKTIYIFKHALIQDAAYHSLLKGTRQNYHRIIAQELERNVPEIAESQPETLGHHFSEAGLAEPAISYWQKAGEIATRRSADIEAMAHFTKGLELLKTLPETDECMKRELSLLIAMGSSLIAIKGQGAPEIEQTYSRALSLCNKVGNKHALFTVMRGLFNHYITFGKYQICNEYSQELLEIAEGLNDNNYLMAAHRVLGSKSFWCGELITSKSHFDKVLSLYDPQQHHKQAFIYWTDQGIHGLSIMSGVLWLLGYPDQALSRSQEALSLARELSHSYSLAMVIVYNAFYHCFCQEVQKAKELSEELIELSIKQRFPIFLRLGTVISCWAMGMHRKDMESVSEMQQAIDDLWKVPFRHIRTLFLYLMSQLCTKARKTERGLAVLEEALQFADETGERVWEAELHRLKGEFLLDQSKDNQSSAELCFNNALKIAQELQAKSLELRAAMSMSRLWLSQGKKEDTRSLLSEIYRWFTEGFDTVDLKHAKELLNELS